MLILFRWVHNATKSPLLRLPAEIRKMIWDYVLGDHTILLRFKFDKPGCTLTSRYRYREFYDPGKFCCVTFPGHVNPFVQGSYRCYKKGFTLLNGVCRMMLKETALLPYELNTWAATDDMLMWRYMCGDKRLTILQRKAMSTYFSTESYYNHSIVKAILCFPGLQRMYYKASNWGSVSLDVVDCHKSKVRSRFNAQLGGRGRMISLTPSGSEINFSKIPYQELSRLQFLGIEDNPNLPAGHVTQT